MTRGVSHVRSEVEQLQFMRALQDIWSIQGRSVLAAFDLSPFPLICDLGGECPLQASEPPFASPVGGVLSLLA